LATRLIVATANQHKLQEIHRMLKGVRLEAKGVKVKEDGKTFEANAVKKVKAIKLLPDEIAIADDSGLMVDSLGGKPGVKSARFAKPPTSFNLCTKLLRVMRQTKDQRLKTKDRGAKFICVMAVKYPSGRIKTVRGACRGKIIHEMRGRHGFGYDPVFVPAGYKKTFAEMKPAMKDRLSHRALALLKVKSII
jgi:XTP/dITP diphosphohydrolase